MYIICSDPIVELSSSAVPTASNILLSLGSLCPEKVLDTPVHDVQTVFRHLPISLLGYTVESTYSVTFVTLSRVDFQPLVVRCFVREIPEAGRLGYEFDWLVIVGRIRTWRRKVCKAVNSAAEQVPWLTKLRTRATKNVGVAHDYVSRGTDCTCSAMSVPKLLYSYSGSTLQQPLLPDTPPQATFSAVEMSDSKKSETSDNDFSDIYPVLQQTHSFTSEAFHRFGFGNGKEVGAEPVRLVGATAARLPRGGGASDSEGKFGGGVDANSDPEVAAFAGKEEGARGGEPELDLNYTITGVSGTSSAAINCGRMCTHYPCIYG